MQVLLCLKKKFFIETTKIFLFAKKFTLFTAAAMFSVGVSEICYRERKLWQMFPTTVYRARRR